MSFSIGQRVVYNGKDAMTYADAGQTGTVSEMPAHWAFKQDDTTMVTFDEYPGIQEVLTDCLEVLNG